MDIFALNHETLLYSTCTCETNDPRALVPTNHNLKLMNVMASITPTMIVKLEPNPTL